MKYLAVIYFILAIMCFTACGNQVSSVPTSQAPIVPDPAPRSWPNTTPSPTPTECVNSDSVECSTDDLNQ